MNHYRMPTEDIGFVLFDVLQAPAQLAALPAFGEADEPLMRQLLNEMAKFIDGEIAPLNRTGDEVGAQWKDGAVTMPPGFRDAYQAFWQAGWPALSAAAEDGGQGLPAVIEAVLYENLSAANHGWTMAPGLLHGAYECIRHHASDELKAAYLEKVATGEWLRTVWEWRQWIEHRSFDVAMPDIARTGLSEGKRIAALCDSFNLPIAPHVGGGGILAVAASIHYSAAIPNFQILEHSHKANANKARVTSQFPEPVDGAFPLDDQPGLGVTIDEEAVARYAVADFTP